MHVRDIADCVGLRYPHASLDLFKHTAKTGRCTHFIPSCRRWRMVMYMPKKIIFEAQYCTCPFRPECTHLLNVMLLALIYCACGCRSRSQRSRTVATRRFRSSNRSKMADVDRGIRIMYGRGCRGMKPFFLYFLAVEISYHARHWLLAIVASPPRLPFASPWVQPLVYGIWTNAVLAVANATTPQTSKHPHSRVTQTLSKWADCTPFFLKRTRLLNALLLRLCFPPVCSINPSKSKSVVSPPVRRNLVAWTAMETFLVECALGLADRFSRLHCRGWSVRGGRGPGQKNMELDSPMRTVGGPRAKQKARMKEEAQKELQGDVKMQEGELIARVSLFHSDSAVAVKGHCHFLLLGGLFCDGEPFSRRVLNG